MKTTIITISIALSFALGYVLGINYTHGILQKEIPVIQIKRDTILKKVKTKPLILEKVKTKIIYTKDTVIITKPFKAIVDTVIKRDTVFAQFQYPQNLFSLSIKSKPDTIKTYSIIYKELKEKKEKWWEKPLIIFSSLTAGYLIGTSSK